MAWAGSGNLNTVVQANTCVVVEPGTYTISYQVFIPGGHLLTGVAGLRDSTVLMADRSVSWSGTTGMIDTSAPYTEPSQLSHLTVNGHSYQSRCPSYPCNDGANIGVSAPSMIMTDVRVLNARCNGVGAYQSLVLLNVFTTVITDSDIEGNGFNCEPSASPPGAGLYIHPVTQATSRIEVTGTTIQNNAGPGAEIYQSFLGGMFTGNTVQNNQQGYGAVSLTDSSNWTITNNVLQQPSGTPGKSNCTYPASTGSHGAAVFLCAYDYNVTGNVIGPNVQVNGPYGIVASWNNTSGNRSSGNTFTGNVISAAYTGCIDHNAVGSNTWNGNNCQAGLTPAPPTYY